MVSDAELGTVSIVGTGMASAPGYAATMFRTLFEHGINIELISTSDIRITCLVSRERVPDAVRALHDAFALEQQARTLQHVSTLFPNVPLVEMAEKAVVKLEAADAEEAAAE